ncbi:MAG TPA: hypothetical protein VLK84_16580 [Longimicrobium sp.]|nr:hypothetical protein [Longimicrobium sp.]
MYASHFIPRVVASLLAVSLGTGACSANERQAEPAQGSDNRIAGMKDDAKANLKNDAEEDQRGRDSARAARIHFDMDTTLALTLKELADGRHVLIRNPTERAGLRVELQDERETHPLSSVLKLPDTPLVLPKGTRSRPGTTLVRLTAGMTTSNARPGSYEGRLLVSDTGGVHAERAVRITVPERLPAPLTVAGDTGWTADVYKLALLPTARAYFFDNAEGRCARDNRDRQGFAASGGAAAVRFVMGTCTRDNVVPLEGARTHGTKPRSDARADSAKAAQANRDSVADPVIVERPAQVLLGVLHAEKGGDQALVWWTADSLKVGGSRQGVELQFTSLDRPGTYYGKIDLARAGAEGIVGLRVQMTHDWFFAMLAIGLGVVLSWWLQNYVRTRRAVLRMQETSAELVSRIETADAKLQSLDSRRGGYRPYAVDESLLVRLHRVDRKLQQHAYDGVVLEPGKADHDALRTELEQCEESVITWEEFAATLHRLRTELDSANKAANTWGAGAPAEKPHLLAEAEKLFDGDRLATAALAPLDKKVANASEDVCSWREVVEAAADLRTRLAGVGADDPQARTTRAQLTAAVAELWTAADAASVKAVADQIEKADGKFRPGAKARVFKLLGVGPREFAPGAPAAAAPAVTARADTAPSPSQDVSQDPEGTPMRGTTAGETGKRAKPQTAMERRRQAESRRKWNDILYFGVTLLVAVATGFNELYLDAFGFGAMQDYMVALLWGFGTKMGLDTVRAAVEGGRLPWPARKDAAPTPTGTAATGAGTTTTTPTTPNQGQAAGSTAQPDDKPSPLPQNEGDPEDDGENAPNTAAAGERVKSAEELASAG